MQWTEVKVVIERFAGEHILDMIAAVFYDLGLHGVVIDDPHLRPDEKWGPDAVMPPQRHAVSGYFPQNEELDTNIGQLREKLKILERLNGFHSHLIFRDIGESDWAEAWKKFFHPVKVSQNITIKPTWKKLTPPPEEIVIEIDPGMAFGTGTHPTTIMCIRMLQRYLTPMDRLLDVGTGSGILLVAAAKLGVQKMTGIDNDRLAIEIAQSNLILNRVEPECFELVRGHLLDKVDEQFDIVVANLLTDIIIELIDDVRRIIKPGGTLICSGIYADNQDRVLKKLKICRMQLLEQIQLEDWVCLVGRIPQTK